MRTVIWPVLVVMVLPTAVEKLTAPARRRVVESVEACRVDATFAPFAEKEEAPSVDTFILSEVRSFVAALKAVMVQPVAVENTRDFTVR